jgi:small subunit ribosomal protein S4e
MAVTKRYAAPRFWPLEVKAKKYVATPLPGPHSKSACIPISIILRDMLKHAHTMKEAREILVRGVVRVNGSVRRERNFPVGLMDIVDIDGECYRVVSAKYGLKLIKADETGIRLAKIINKTSRGKNLVQLNLHDGTNMLVSKDEYKTNDVIVIDIEKKTIKQHIKFDKGCFAIVADGHNCGMFGKVHSIDRKLNTVTLEDGDNKIIVPLRYIFIVGHQKPEITVSE